MKNREIFEYTTMENWVKNLHFHSSQFSPTKDWLNGFKDILDDIEYNVWNNKNLTNEQIDYLHLSWANLFEVYWDMWEFMRIKEKIERTLNKIPLK